MNITNHELMIMLSWIKGELVSKQLLKKETYNFKWSKLLVSIMTYDSIGLGDKNISIEESEFEEIFSNSLEVYNRLNIDEIKHNIQFADETLKNNPKIGKIFESIEFDDNFIKEELKKIDDYCRIMDDVLINYDFNTKSLKEEQLQKLKQKLETYIKNEEYEKCSEIQSLIQKKESNI